jgi:hypothetical protein
MRMERLEWPQMQARVAIQKQSSIVDQNLLLLADWWESAYSATSATIATSYLHQSIVPWKEKLLWAGIL